MSSCHRSGFVRAKCIVVQDDPFWSSEISAALLSAAVEVIHVADGRQAPAMARLHPDASMVLDIILPEVDGVEVLRRPGALAPDMAVLAVTGGGHPDAAFHPMLHSIWSALGQSVPRSRLPSRSRMANVLITGRRWPPDS